jgi:hypothetical protein
VEATGVDRYTRGLDKVKNECTDFEMSMSNKLTMVDNE